MGIKHCCYILYFTLALVTLLQPVRSAEDVEEFLPSANETRRSLKACEAHNIIDKCWRCKADWANNRQALADCAQGFAKGTYGGKHGDVYTVTSDKDDDVANPKEGTLRFAAAQNRPLWIIFKRNMVIHLNQELVVNSDKTIDGRGVKVNIVNAGLTLMNVKNIIIHNINIHDIKVCPGGMIKSNDGPPILRQQSDGDAINVAGSSQIWIDHCSLSKASDGLLDITLGSSHVTVSNCKFTQHQFVLLLGADDTHYQDKGMLATVAFNMFTDHVDQRMPRCRFGFFQVVNNNYDRWGTYAIGGSSAPTILSQGNRFFAPDDIIKKNVLARTGTGNAESMSWNWRTDRDLLENGAIFLPSGSDPVLTPEQKAGMIPAEPGEAVLRLTSSAGVLSCHQGAPC
uniref:Pectate lyase 1 n=2 Tax=Ambrosia artemisiifolia TaxID=4212 RepID=PLY1_AMBAR|nr:RecName: Full=Pectate lyase 1; AltName: Full=Antigen Amb a I; AltName: Full=Antigen E; Short=AgE; AltName: Full=Pollen allergen Amb a 1.2; AltName: Full=Protein AaBA; AltName: Allergen=Amb a 1.2; Flags: Precursor [Ambrosia artemisiifolia]AAA32666.1 Amb a I.2 [Ambrosia artemisiifolia]AAA32667.1 Amb a I.2 precursor protein [Ambrosia artemisiifolia]